MNDKKIDPQSLLNESAREERQQSLFDVEDVYKKHWQDMPEFIQENLMPWKTIYVHFRNLEDMLEFQEIIGQKFTTESKFIWHPKAEMFEAKRYRYVDAGDELEELDE